MQSSPCSLKRADGQLGRYRKQPPGNQMQASPFEARAGPRSLRRSTSNVALQTPDRNHATTQPHNHTTHSSLLAIGLDELHALYQHCLTICKTFRHVIYRCDDDDVLIVADTASVAYLIPSDTTRMSYLIPSDATSVSYLIPPDTTPLSYLKV